MKGSNDDKSFQNISSFNTDLNSVLGELEEGHYLFIIADLKKANLFLFNRGEVETTRYIMDPSVNKKIKSNSGELSGRNTKLEHKIDNQIHKHLQIVVNEIPTLLSGKHINGVFIGGHKTMFSAIEKILPSDLQKKLRGEFVTELNISREELINHCKYALSKYLKQ